MKILVGYVPLPSEKGIPLLSQNRQFQWFNKPTYIYPMVPASAATIAKTDGHDVLWLDAIAEQLTPEQFDARYTEFAPDLFLLETKTPVIKPTWEAVKRLKALHPAGRIALCGDHVTALPQETLENCPVDYILTGGDFDILLQKLANHLDGKAELPPGVWYRDGETLANTGPFTLDAPLDDLPFVDRELTRWDLYSRENGKVALSATLAEPSNPLGKPAISISVRDDGEGITDENIPKLTQRFYRVDKSRSRHLGGTGLGLAIVKHILVRHQGKLVIESELGKGSIFTVYLPINN